MSYAEAMRKIGEVIVGAGGQASIAFSNIPQGYRSLELHVTGQTSNATEVLCDAQFNGDTGANYSYEECYAAAATPGAASSTGQTSLLLGLLSPSSGNYPAVMRWLFPDYAGTTFYKAGTGTAGRRTGAGLTSEVILANWASTAAITSISLAPSSGNFVQNTVCSLYGIV